MKRIRGAMKSLIKIDYYPTRRWRRIDITRLYGDSGMCILVGQYRKVILRDIGFKLNIFNIQCQSSILHHGILSYAAHLYRVGGVNNLLFCWLGDASSIRWYLTVESSAWDRRASVAASQRVRRFRHVLTRTDCTSRGSRVPTLNQFEGFRRPVMWQNGK